jgi:starch phosphorylase
VSDTGVWARIDDIPDEELWRVRQRRRERMVQFARGRLTAQLAQRNRSDVEIRQAKEVLNPEALTLGFARRFATYKRATLLLSNPDRLLRLLTDEARPVQMVVAGKAHPRDDGGKEMIRQIVQFARRPEARNRIVFLEDYDLTVARHLVQGVDLWLNTPRRPMEASGTSGMKVLANGGLNASVPDGWWAEGYDPRVGWAIGHGEEYADPGEQDRIEAELLYEILEKEVIPLFYDRNAGDLPRAWIGRIKSSMRILCPVYNTHRMVSEYGRRFYFPSSERYLRLTRDRLAPAKALVDWKRMMREQWPQVRVESVTTEASASEQNLKVGATVHVIAEVSLGGLKPADVTVQAYHGPLDADHQVLHGTPLSLDFVATADGRSRYEGEIPCTTSGLQGFSVRILPKHPDAVLPHELALVAWE